MLVHSSVTALFLSLALITVGTLSGEDGPKPKPADISAIRVSGPYLHQNLTVFLLHQDQRDDREFITLNEGLKSGKVKVTELANEQVNTLLIENVSDKPLFLQEGDRVTGGKQDRTLYTSLVIGPKSKPQPIPAFCIEASRWRVGDTGKQFTGNANPGYASNSVRFAGKLGKSQQRVWREVARNKMQLKEAIGSKNSNSSLNEAVDSKKVVESTKAFRDKLGKLLEQHEDAVGVAFAVNGKMMEINAFPGNKLATKIYPRMLETYALDAIGTAVKDEKAVKRKPLVANDVVALMKSASDSKIHRQEEVNSYNQLVILAENVAESAKEQTYQCQTNYDGRMVHLQWIRAAKQIAAAEQPSRYNNLNTQRNPQIQIEGNQIEGNQIELQIELQIENP